MDLGKRPDGPSDGPETAPAQPPVVGQSLLGPGGVGGVPVRRPRGLVSLNLRYYAIRAALFGGFLTVLLVVSDIDGLLAFALAVVASGLVSFPLAIRQRRAGIDALEVRRDGRR